VRRGRDGRDWVRNMKSQKRELNTGCCQRQKESDTPIFIPSKKGTQKKETSQRRDLGREEGFYQGMGKTSLEGGLDAAEVGQ